MALAFDIERVVRDLLRCDLHRRAGSRDLVGHVMDLLYYGEFQIVEQVTAWSEQDQTNLVGLRGPAEAGGGLLLSSALEGATALDPLEWTETEEDPFNATLRDGMMFGAGAASAKIALACQVVAAASIDAKLLKRPIIIGALLGDDARASGATHVLDSGVASPRAALVGEGTRLELVSAHRGLLSLALELHAPSTPTPSDARWFRVRIAGQPASSAAPTLGENALGRALGLIVAWRAAGHRFSVHALSGGEAIGRIARRTELYVATTEPGFTPLGRALEVEAIAAPSLVGPSIDAALDAWFRLAPRLWELLRWASPESIGEFCPTRPLVALTRIVTHPDGSIRVHLDHRPAPGEAVETLVRDVEALARQPGMAPATVLVEVERSLLPFQGDDTGPLAQWARSALVEIDVPPVVGTYAGHTEAFATAGAGIETLVFGPGDTLAHAHRPNELTLMLHVERARAFYERMIRKICC